MRLTLFFIFLFFASISSAQTVVAIQHKGLGYQFVNKQTQSPANDLIWDEAEPFVNGFARVLKQDHFSFVDHSGKLICETQFDAARNFSNRLAAVKKGTAWGFIDQSGKAVIPFQYEIVFDFKETVTAVYKNKKWFLINTKGELLKTLDITVFYGFKNGLARIEKDGRTGLMNIRGEIALNNIIAKTPQTLRIPYNRAAANNSSSACPDNIDFEYGSFLNWKCFTGRVDSVGTTNVITVTPSAPTPNRHTIYNRVLPSPLDAYGLFPTNPPDGSNFAVRLGNTNIGAQAERIQYPIHVPLNDSNFSIKYDYAVVFEDPGHTTWTQPRFTVRLFDSAANTYVDCASFEYISTSNLPGFARSTVDTGVVYKPWSSVFVSLRGYAGKTMFLEFTTADCVRRGHWGYAYVDVEKPCGQSVQVQYECTSPNITTLTGPPGFQLYNWWDSSFTTLMGSGQQVLFNPGPPANSTVWLEMIPFNDFGCRDTIPVKITGVFNANFTLSDTLAVCAPHTFTFYNSNVPSSSALWNFGDGGTASGDTVTHTFLLPGNYNVTLDVILPSGCVGTIQKNVSILQPVGSFYFNGAYFCNSQQVRFDAVVSDADSLFWDFGDGNILPTFQTTVFHTYALPGLYLPFLTVQSAFGCHNTLPGPDTIRIEKLRAGFSYTQESACGSTVVNLTDTSYAYFGINSYDWDFGDGSTGSGSNVSHTYTTSGTYNIQLIITGISGCTDTIVKPVTITVNSKPVASIIAPGMQCQSTAVTFNSNIVSADAINLIQWTASNGSSGSGNNFTVTFAQPGNYTVQLIAGTIHGCYDTATHAIRIYPTADMLQPADQLLCSGNSTTAVHFSGTVPGTIFSWTNNNPSIGLAAGGSGDIASFTAVNNSAAPVIATITVTASANGCPGPAKTFTITVDPIADVVQPSNQSLCHGTSTTAISFTGTVSNTSYSWTNNNSSIGLAASGNGAIPSFTAINNTATPVTATITVIPTANGCPGPSKTFTITVNPVPTVAQPNDQALCNGTATTVINFTGTVTAATYNWTNNNASIGLAANGTGDIPSFIAVNSSTSPVTATVTVVPAAYGCTGPSKTVDIIVNPTPAVAQPINQVLCKNDPTTAIVFAGSVSGTVYNWANNNTLIGLAANGTGDIPSFTAINNTTQPVTATLTVTANANGCASPARIFTITVNPSPAVTQPADQSLCNGSATSIVYFATAVSGASFNWTNDNTSIGLAATGTGNIPSFTAVNGTTAPVTATISVTATANGCPGPPKTFTITVDPVASVFQPADQTVCNGMSTAVIGFTGPVNGSSFTWTNDNPSIGLAANGSGDILPFTAINNSNIPVTATITVTATASGCNGSSKTFRITVKPTADVSQPANQSLCNGTTTAAVSFTSSVANTTYSWTNNNISVGLAASGNGAIPAFTALNASSVPVTATITAIPTANGCPGPEKTFMLTVNPTPAAVQPADQLLCSGGTTNAVNFTGSVNTASYSWVNDNPSIGLAANGSGNITSFTAINNSGTISTATITVVPSANSCPGPAKTFLIVVKPAPNVAPVVNQALCNGANTTAIIFSSNVSGASFSWSNNTPSIGLAATGIGNIASFTALNTTDSTVTALINVRASANGCNGNIRNAAIAVNPTPDVSANNDMNVCRGNTVQLNASGAAQFSWSPATGLSCTNCSNPVTTPVDSIRYIVKGTSAAGCIGFDSIFLKVINPFQMRVKPGDTLCIGESAHLQAMDANTYLWSPPAGLDNVSIAAPTATPQVTTLYQVIGYDAYHCFTDTGYVRINVGPRPTVNIGSDVNTTTGTTMTLHPVISNGPIISYLWTPATGLSCTDCPNPTTTVTNNIEYSLTVTNNYGCVAKDVMRVTVFCLDGQVFIPNAFTPDGDGLNDILMVRGKGISVKTFRIFNRWGELVFEKKDFNPNDPKFGWDGKVRGVAASPDVFVYTAEVVCDNGIIYTYKGNTTILK